MACILLSVNLYFQCKATAPVSLMKKLNPQIKVTNLIEFFVVFEDPNYQKMCQSHVIRAVPYCDRNIEGMVQATQY